jgi:cytochrome c biogenesis protein CcdA/glutaredoxin
MKQIMPILLMVLLALFAVPAIAEPADQTDAPAAAANHVDMVIVHGNGCPHCAKLLSFMDGVQERYPDLHVVVYEVYFDKNNRKIAQELAKAYGKDLGGVPVVFINGQMIVGFNNAIGDAIEAEVKHCSEVQCESPLDRIGLEPHSEIIVVESESSPGRNPALLEKVTIPAVVSAALVDAINPCAFAVLIILLTTILATKSRRRALLAGLAFTVSIYISYFLMGLGLFSALRASGLTSMFYAVVATLAIIVGLFNLKDYLWYGKWFKMEVPEKWRPKMKSLLRGITSIPGAFMIGFVISLFLLPCTSGPYIVILGFLAEAAMRNQAIMLLIIYNFIFILPMLVITFAIYFGFTTTEQAEEWRQRKLKALHLVAGAIILLIGIGMFVAMWLGYV